MDSNQEFTELKERSMTARKGRDGQVYHPLTRARIVAGCVALTNLNGDAPKTHVLLISSKSHRDRWVLPKGGCELDEEPHVSALREGWEEAGVVGSCERALGQLKDSRPQKLKGGEIQPRPEYMFFEIHVARLENNFPEMGERVRKWMRYDEAKEALAWRAEMVEALNRSSIER